MVSVYDSAIKVILKPFGHDHTDLAVLKTLHTVVFSLSSNKYFLNFKAPNERCSPRIRTDSDGNRRILGFEAGYWKHTIRLMFWTGHIIVECTVLLHNQVKDYTHAGATEVILYLVRNGVAGILEKSLPKQKEYTTADGSFQKSIYRDRQLRSPLALRPNR